MTADPFIDSRTVLRILVILDHEAAARTHRVGHGPEEGHVHRVVGRLVLIPDLPAHGTPEDLLEL